MADIDLDFLARQMESLLTEMLGLREVVLARYTPRGITDDEGTSMGRNPQ